jgi:aminoglycoside phosphotransferase (APT) family kinase protein
MTIDELVPQSEVAAVIARALGDERWLSLSIELVSGGKSNLTFELTSSVGSLILRRPPTGVLLPKAHDMVREVRVQRSLEMTSVPVPEIVLLEESRGTCLAGRATGGLRNNPG